MNVDRLPDSTDDPLPDTEPTRSTDSPAPENPAPPDPQPEHHSRPEQPPEQERKPDQAQQPGKGQHPAREHPAESSPAQTDSPAPTDETPNRAEPRSRQEHADFLLPPDAAGQPPRLGDRTEREAPPAKASPSEGAEPAALDDLAANPHGYTLSGSEDSNVEEKPDDASAIPKGDTGNGEMQPREDPPDHQFDPESNSSEEADQYQFEDTKFPRGSGHADKAPGQDAQPDDTNTSSSAPHDQDVAKLDDDVALADDQIGPLTDKWAEHLVEVREGLDSARRAGLISKRLYTIDGAGEIWNEERDRLHDAIIEDLYSRAADVPCEFKAIIAGGLGGAGKTTVLTQYAGIDLSQYLMINPDDMKEEMAQRGMIPEVEGLSPMEASELVHEESSYLASQLALRAQADGKNLIWDITMSSEESVEGRINELASAGYTQIDGIFVDISVLDKPETDRVKTSRRSRKIPSRERPGRQVCPAGGDRESGRPRMG